MQNDYPDKPEASASASTPIPIAFYGTPPDQQAYLEKHFIESGMSVTVSYDKNSLSPENYPAGKNTAILGVFVDSPVTGATMDAFPGLKLITTLSTGFDHIDIAEAAKRGIAVCNVPSYGENTVAEYAFGLILTLSRKIYAAADQIKETSNFNLRGLRGFDLKGKTLGVVGTGKIGRHAIKIARGFEMDVAAYDPYPNEQASREFGYSYMPLNELLASSDIVTLHVPYSKETHHLINADALSKMKPSSILINTSRGGVVDTDALVKALAEKKIAAAGLDVLEEEGAVKDELAFLSGDHPNAEELRTVLENHALMKMPNVIVTPHNAFNTDEALKRILDTTVDNIKAWTDSRPSNTVGTA